MSILMSLANDTPPTPDTFHSQCPSALSQLVMRLLAKDHTQRPASAEAVIQALAEFGDTGNATPRTSEISPTVVLYPGDSGLALTGTRITPVAQRTNLRLRIAFALGGVLLMLFATVVYRMATDNGTLIVELLDKAVEAKLKSNGLEVRDSKSGRSFSIQTDGSRRESSGEYKLVDGHGYKLLVLNADGLELATNEFKLMRGDKVRVRVVAEANGVTPTVLPQSLAKDPDRRAAEYMLSIRGGIKIKENGQERDIKTVEELPRGAFELTAVNCHVDPKVSDTGLAVFKDCKNLKFLSVSGTQVSDAGLAHFANCKQITELDLNFTKVSDAGLANFKGCNALTRLYLGYTQATDAGLAYFKDCKNLTQLGADCKEVSDDGLANFKDYKNLTWLELSGSRVTDAGLVNFKDCKNLGMLGLSNTQLSDAGLEQVAAYPKLGSVHANNTKISEAGVKKLSAALPGRRIEWDGATIEPRP